MKINNFEKEFIFENNKFEFSFQLSNTKIVNIDILDLLNIKPNYFINLNYTIDDDIVTCNSELSHYRLLKHAKLSQIERFDLAYTCLKFLDLNNSILIPILHPENILLDVDNTPYLIYRGIENYLEPYEFMYDDFLLQLKCLILSIIEDSDFENLYNGFAKINLNNNFKKQLFESKNKEELSNVLVTAIDNQKRVESDKKIYVNKKRFSFFKNISIVFVVVSILLSGLASYAYLVEKPQLNSYLTASTNYVNKNYSEVISGLSKYKIDKLPKSQKHILAVSSINVLSLTPEQKNNILNRISESTNENILDCWIALGRGDYDLAIDKAIKSDDLDLYLFSLIRYKDALKSGNQFKNLSGNDIKTKISEIDSQIEEIQKKDSN